MGLWISSRPVVCFYQFDFCIYFICVLLNKTADRVLSAGLRKTVAQRTWQDGRNCLQWSRIQILHAMKEYGRQIGTKFAENG